MALRWGLSHGLSEPIFREFLLDTARVRDDFFFVVQIYIKSFKTSLKHHTKSYK